VTLRNGTPIKFSPVGVSDALDSSNVFPGAMAQLSNLIPDPTTKNLWQCRPAAIAFADFATQGGDFDPDDFGPDFYTGFNLGATGGFISALKIVGDRVFGMIATSLNPGHDQPFCYDLITGAFVFISGVTSANTPFSPTTSGDWVPPTMDLIGVNLVVTHPGYTGAGGIMFGWFNISDPNAITWNAGNTVTTLLPCPPTAVKQFFNRAYFLVNPPTGQPGAYFTDVLTLTITDPTHIITFNDNVKLTAIGALPLNSQLTGGTIQSLIVFKGAAQMWQITGDAAIASNPLSVNAMNVATGTNAPLSIVATSKGLAFIAPDGLRVIMFNGTISDPIGDAGSGVTLPFIFAIAPSRIAAACTAKVLRISVQNGFAVGTPNQEWWYDIPRGCWSGPHTFPASQIQPYNNTFIEAPIGVLGKLFQSDSVQGNTSTYVENGNQMSFTWATSMLPSTQQMSENAMVETTLNIGFPDGQQVAIYAVDENGAVFSSVVLAATIPSTVWGSFVWGQALWQGASNALAPRQMKWPIPIVFQRLAIIATGNCAQNLKLGDLFMRYQQLGYLLQQDANVA
jgi:hypothetical protein